MPNAHEKRVSEMALIKGYKLEKVGKGVHHGRFAIVNIAQGARMTSGIQGSEYTFSIDEAESWLAKAAK
jgi:hypothetical protein